MAYTLISFIGTGMYDGGYRETEYVFSNNKKVKTHIFLNALLEVKYRPFSKIILLGTKTSGWDMLVEDNEDLWLEVRQARESDLITSELLKKVETCVSEKIKIPVVIKSHTDVIDESTSLEIFNFYNSIIPEITDENILFDITHSFRSMPILLYQALQFSISNNEKIKNVELVYGEFIKDKGAIVRDLSSYWKYSQITNAISIFEEKLDGFLLANLIEDDWESGSKALKRFSEIVQTNFCHQIVDVSRQLRNSLQKYPENAPLYLEKVKDLVKKLCDLTQNDNKRTSAVLYDFSNFLYEHTLNVQAIICLQVAVETAVCEKYNGPIGDYDWWQEKGKSQLRELENNCSRAELKNPLMKLECFRNQIAHGGAKNKEGNFPHAANIPNIYKSGLRGFENLIKKLEEC